MNAFGQDALNPVRVAAHVHTDYDDGSGSAEDVIGLAEATDVEVLLLSDHHRPHALRDGWHGRAGEGRVLVIVGAEFSTQTGHHLLGAGVHVPVASRQMPNAEALRILAHLGGRTFVAHPQGARLFGVLPKLVPWTEYDLAEYDGLEIWSYLQDWFASVRPWRLGRMCRQPADFITGPDPGVLAAWDAQAVHRRVAGLGALDVHARLLPLGLGGVFRWARDGILPYRTCFESFAHYALVPLDWGRDATRDIAAVLDALAGARGWVAHDALESGRDVLYALEEDDTLLPVGTEVAFREEAQALLAFAPVDAELTLRNRGEIVARAEGRELRHVAAAPGEYRLEIALAGRPWVCTNHIYLREPGHRSLLRDLR